MHLYIATHRRDPDGVCSAAILARYAQRENWPYTLFFVDYVTLEKDLRVIRQQMTKSSFLALIDLGLDSRLWPTVKAFLEAIQHQKIRVYWGDHHAWDMEYITLVRSLGVSLDLQKSKDAVSAEIVQHRFLPDDPVARRLSFIARDHDLWLRTDPISLDLADVISYYDFLDHRVPTSTRLTMLALKLAKGTFWDDELEAAHREYLKKKENALERSLAKAQAMTLGKFRVVFFYADLLLSSTTAGSLALEQFSVDLSVGIWPDGRIGFRRANDALDCAVIAALFGGGGHAFAAGAEWPESISELEFPQVKDELLKRLSNYPPFKGE